ncbi:hypothetical protein DMI69_05720 [Escherichia coli]|nr:hypothetical protein [Escherichia coli]
MIQLYSLAVFLTGNVREAASTVRAKNAPRKSSASWRRNNSGASGGFEAILTREKMGSTGIGNGIAIPHGKLEEDTLRAVGVFVQLETPIARCHRQPTGRLTFALLVPADQTKTHLHTLSLVAKRLADKTICRRLRAAQSDEELYQIITDTEGTRMKRSYSVMSLLDVVRRNSTWY